MTGGGFFFPKLLAMIVYCSLIAIRSRRGIPMMPVQPQALPISLVILTWPCLAGLGGLGCLGWID